MVINRLIPLLIILAIMVIGFLYLFSSFKKVADKMNFVQEYLAKYSDFIQGYSKQKNDPDLFFWLTQKVIKIQNTLGPYGKMALYRPAFSTYAYQNYEIFTNTLSEIGRGQAHQDDIRMVAETLIRYLGVIEDQVNAEKNKLKNPLIWFREGISIIILFPLYLLKGLGLSISGTIRKVSDSIIIKIISGLISIVALIGGIFSIIAGWDNMMKIISGLFLM